MDFYRLLPRFWAQNRPTSLAWDEALNRALDLGISCLGSHTANIGPFEVWVANYPYSFGYDTHNSLNELPTVRTRLRLRRACRAWQAAQYAKQFASGD